MTPEGDRVRRGHTRAIAGALASALLLGACASNGSEATETPTEVASPTESASPTPSPTPIASDSDPSEPAPQVTMRGETQDDLRRVVTEVLALRDWVFAHPDESFRLREAYDPKCACLDNIQTFIDEQLLAKDLRIVMREPVRVDTVEIVEEAVGRIDVRVTMAEPPADILNADGEVVESVEDFRAPQTDIWSFTVDGTDELSLVAIQSAAS